MKVLSHAALALSSALLIGWCAAGCGASSAPSPRPLSLVVIGDSIPNNAPYDCPGCVGFADQYAEALGKATHRTVTTSNLSEHTGLTLPMLLKELPSLREQLSSADAILVGIAHNSIELNADRPCGTRVVRSGTTFADWSKVDRRCARRTTDHYRPLYDRLFSTIASWRQGRPTVLRTIDTYNDWTGWKPAHLTDKQVSTVVMFHRLWNRMLCSSARAHGFGCADIDRAFNGPNGDRAAGDLLGPDHTHPSQKGNDLIATTLVALGFAPLAPAASRPAAGSSTPATASSPSGAALPRIVLPVTKGETVEGLVDVGGHDIYARCSGTGSPTVVYFTGWAPDRTKRGVDAIEPLEAVDHGRHRICSYERRNTGRSETVRGTQSPEDVVADVDGVLDALGEHGPFVLLGASFGGLVASAYAVAHPGRVAGVLLLDASIPDDVVIDRRHGFTGVCNPSNRHADAWESLERLDNCRLARWAYDRRDREPDVPLTYLAAADPSDRGDVADDPLRKAFVHRWSPGTWKKVAAPHWMDEADPRLVERELDRVIAEAAAS